MPNMTKEQKYERVWNFIQYRARMHLINDLESEEAAELDEAPANQRDAIKETNKKKRLEAGLPLKISTASDVDRMQEYLSDDVVKMLIGKGTPEELNEAYEIFGEINARLKVEYGKEVDQVKSRFGDIKNRDEKVYLVCQKSRTKTGYQDSELFNLSTEVGTYISNAISSEKARDYNFVMGKRSEAVSKEMNEEEKRLYDLGKKMGEYEPKTDEMKAYKNGKAKQLAEAYDLNNISKAYKELSAELTPSVMANITKFDTSRVDTVFMRGILKDMESTGTGKEDKAWYEKMWHSENSPEYTNMLKSINTYIGLIEANEEGKKLFIAQNKMVEAIKGYISGKETVRKHEFGQKRFDDSLRLLSQVMPDQEFDNLIKSINKERHKAKDKNHDIDVDSFNKDKKNPSPDSEYGRLRRLGLEGMDEIQKKTQDFRTNIPEPFKTKKVENRVEAVFKMNPTQTDEAHDHFYKDGTNHFKKFKPIKDEFKSIGHFTR